MPSLMARRDALWIGGVGILSFFQSLMTRNPNNAVAAGYANGPSPASKENPASHASGTAKRCILIWLDGGPSHLDMWDVKPNAPVEVRGPLRSIPTVIPGISISESLPLMAKRLNRTCIVRSVTSPLGEHNLGTHYMLTGYRPSPSIEYASIGSVLSFHRKQTLEIPAFVAVPDFKVGGSTFSSHGFLAPDFAPFSVMSDPASSDFRLPWDAKNEAEINTHLHSLSRRQSLSRQMDQFYSGLTNGPSQQATTPVSLQRAFELLSSQTARAAFRIDTEDPATRERYGSKTIGQSCLLARRLIERDVSFVAVNSTGWDTHADLTLRLRDGFTGAKTPVGLLPALDQALSALLDDLIDRQLFDETLVVVMGEFGRTPKINTGGGRDHWPRVFSVLLAGGGVREGVVYGASDANGESPSSNPVTPEDLIATIYRLLGIDLTTTLRTADGRPIRLVPETASTLHDIIKANA